MRFKLLISLMLAAGVAQAATAYNARADRRSWQAMKVFFTEVFQQADARR